MPRTATRQASSKRLDKAAAFYQHCTPPAERRETKFRHAFWEGKRELVRAALIQVNTNTFALNRFDECGSEAMVMWSDTLQKYKIAANYCHCRHCEPCMRAKANRIAANLTERLEQKAQGRYRFITLTLAHSTTPLVDQVKRLFACFRKLRAKKFWKHTQVGGAFTLEVKLAKHAATQNQSKEHPGEAPAPAPAARWHPHLHIVAEGRWMNKSELSQQWHAITGDSFIVDIREIDRGRDAAHYVGKYITKSTSNNVWADEDARAEWIIASKGVRTCSTYGTWRGWKLTQAKGAAKDWQPIARLTTLIDRASNGEVFAGKLLLILRPPFAFDAAGEGH